MLKTRDSSGTSRLQRSPSIRVFLALLAALLLSLSPLAAQSSDGTVTGTVKDSSGAVLPGADVTLRNVNTSETRAAITNDSGIYRIVAVPRGTYEARAELAGFQTLVQSNVLVTVGETVRLDFALTVGEISEQVTISSEAPVVNTEEGRISNLVDEKRVVDLPLNGRNALQLMELQPGATANPGAAVLGGSAGGNTSFVSGQRNRANNFLLDGTDNNDQFTAGRVAVNPSVDTVQEFRISSNNFSAEFGRNSAAVISVVTKGGTNEFHGSLYEFHRNDALDARSTFASEVEPLRFHQFGGTVGGPIVKDKTFFFTGYEGLRQTRGTSIISTVETPEFRALVAQQFPNSVANFLFQNYPSPNPTSNIRDTGRPVTGLSTDSTPNNPGVANNPNYQPQGASTILFRNVLQTMPDGIPDVGTVSVPISDTVEGDQWNLRVDHEFNSNHKLFGRYIIDDLLSSQRASIVGALVRPDFDQPIVERGQNTTLAHTWIISPTTVNEARFGYARRLRELTAQDAGVPSIAIFGESPLGFGNFATNPALFIQNTFHWVDTVSITVGNHGIKFGGEVRRIQDNSDFAVSRPGYRFDSIHDFAQDEPSQVTIIGVDPSTGLISTNVRAFRFTETGFFFQDDWKVRPNLTLNLGIRHEWYGRPTEINGLLTNMVPGPGNDIFERVATATVEQVDQVVPDDFNNFAPRLGFAWDPTRNGRFVVRGGAGVGYERLFNNSITNIRFNPPFYSFSGANPVQVTAHAGIPIIYGPPAGESIRLTGAPSNIGVEPGAQVVGNIIGWNPAFGTSTQSLRVPDPATRDAYTTNWFFGIQSQAFSSWLLEANYVGNSGKKLGQLVDYNTVRGDLFDGTLNRLNPNFGGINFRALGTSTIYHGGQFQAKKRFSEGYTAQLAYTFSKAIDTGSDIQVGGLPQDARALYLDRGVSDFDVRHRFVSSFLWELPFFQGSSGATRALLGGWQLNGIVSLQSGFPFTVFTSSSFTAGGDFNGDGVNNDRPNTPAFGNTLTGLNRQDYLSGIFAVSDFPRTGFVLGDLGRNTFRGPGFASTDLSLFKNFGLPWFTSEGSKIQFRSEFFNIFNRTNLQRPEGRLNRGTFGRSTQAFPGREIQFALKFIF